MANEITITGQLRIVKDSFYYQSLPPGQFSADLTGKRGPYPGAVQISTSGTNIDLSGFTTPGFVEFKNLDPTNYVIIGAYNGTTFYELFELLPNERYINRFARATAGTTNRLRLKADTAACYVYIGGFEK